MVSILRLGAAVAAGLVLASTSLAQSVMRQGDSRDWTLRFYANIHAWQDPGSQETRRGASYDTWEFEQATVVVPWLERTSMHRVDTSRSTLTVRVDDRDAVPAQANPFRTFNKQHAGSRFAGFAIGPSKAREIELVLTIPMTSYDVFLDDERARAIEWPRGDWPEDALSALEPQVGIELDLSGEPYEGLERVTQSIDNLIKRLGTDPKNAPPYLVAKYLTGAVWAHLQIGRSNGLHTSRTGMVEGLDISGVPLTFVNRRANPFETCALLAYTFRRAGLPARVVFGVIADVPTKREDVITQRTRGKGTYVCWVEFALVEQGRTTWVPIDLNNMMTSSSRAPDISNVDALARPWDGFGTIKNSRYLAPFSHHAHPPMTVKAYGSPGFWGIFATPAEPSRAEQTIRFDITSTPVTSESRNPAQSPAGEEPAQPRRRR
ncbi:MAG: transglutaminase domain-containing protein [Phycisphaeraceae bacterium]|nr:transglutaminase domain-containing protein [Phycisphaeraceae bacterium]